MQQTLLRMSLPKGQPLWPDELRTLVARQDKLVDPLLMGRDNQGRTLHNPPVRFVGSQQWVGLVANPGHEDLLHAHIGAVIKAVSQHLGTPLPVTVEQRELSLVRDQVPRVYAAMHVALKRRHESARNRPVEELFVERLRDGLERQASQFGLDCPMGDELEIGNVRIERQLGMYLKTDQGVTGEAVTLLSKVEFTMFTKLRGFWFAGNLSSRGYGRLVSLDHLARRAA